MFRMRNQLSENLVIFVFISFVSMSILGVSMSMQTVDGKMSSCPFTAGQTAMCQMSVMEHITEWQAAFTGISAKTKFSVLALVLMAATLIPFIKPFSGLKNLPELTLRILAYQKSHFAKTFDPLLLALSDGILNPKIYDSRGF